MALLPLFEIVPAADLVDTLNILVNAINEVETRLLQMVSLEVALTTPDGAAVTGMDIDSDIMPFNFTVTHAFASARGLVSGSALRMDIMCNGSSIFSTNKLTIDVGGQWSGLSVVQPIIIRPDIQRGAKFSYDVLSTGATTGLKVWVMGYWS